MDVIYYGHIVVSSIYDLAPWLVEPIRNLLVQLSLGSSVLGDLLQNPTTAGSMSGSTQQVQGATAFTVTLAKKVRAVIVKLVKAATDCRISDNKPRQFSMQLATET